MQPDKVLHDTINVRDWKRKRYDGNDVEYMLRHYPYLEEITFDVDCEGSRLSEVEQTEEWIRLAAARHPRRPRLLGMKRINQDKMMMGDSSPGV